MSRVAALLIVTAVWAAIYLPALGSFEIKGEEGRRILPAVAMLESGNYIVPRVGSAAYFRKPPLINWLVAASFKVFGQRNEWTARLPSAFCVLGVAVAFVTVARASLRPAGSVLAALIWLTNFGIIEKGRLIEIEALYVSLCGLAIIFWLSFWEQNKSPWLIWIPASIFLGLGLLAKGPAHLLFFYAIVLAVVWRAKDARILFHPAHLVGIALMLGIFAAWAVPFAQSTTLNVAMFKWSRQFSGRMSGEDFKFSSWILNIPRSLIYFFPWLLALPLLRFERFRDDKQRRLARALAWGVGVPLLIVDLVPGALARYTMPVLAPLSWLWASSYTGAAFVQPRWIAANGEKFWRTMVVAFVGLGLAIGMIGYPLAATFLKDRQRVKNVAAKINAIVPPTETLYAVDPNYQPLLFYVRAPLEYVSSVPELPDHTHYFLVQSENEAEAAASKKWVPRQTHLLLRVSGYGQREIILFAVGPT